MDEYGRRGLLRRMAIVAAVGGGAAVAVSSADELKASAPVSGVQVGPWMYIPPGQPIQPAIQAGARAILLGDGEYPIDEPIVPTDGCTISGIGQRTRILATKSMGAMVAIGDGGPVDGVTVSDLVLDCAKRASIGIDLDINGTKGFYQDEPDSVCRIDDVWVYDPAEDGLVYRGSDTQACITTRVRVRRAGRYGFRVEAPDNWFTNCEATVTSRTGETAGFYVGVAIKGSNGIGGGSNRFVSCKAWYCGDYGYHVKGTRNRFMECESQDTGSHGWYIEYDKNVFSACVADTAGYHAVGGTPGSADGFYIEAADHTSMTGCQAFDRRPSDHPAQQRHGFNVPRSMVTEGRLVAATGYDNTAPLINQR